MTHSKKSKGRKVESTSTEKQWKNSGMDWDGRDEAGRFTRGHKHGFKPGESGNPHGRPRTEVLSEACRHALARVVPGDLEERTYAEVIAERLCELAASGNIKAALFLADRAEGKPKQVIEPPSTITLENAHILLSQIRRQRMERED